jgi:hypothetical protein
MRLSRMKPQFDAPDLSGVMTAAEIETWYLAAQGDHWHQRQMPVGPGIMAAIAGVTHIWIRYFIEHQERYAPHRYGVAVHKMSDAIKSIEARRVIWSGGVKRGRKTEISYLRAASLSRPRMAEDRAFDPRARCSTCGCNKWLPASVYGKRHILCYSCLPPDQWPSFGAVPSDVNLIARYMREQNAKLCVPLDRVQ